MNTMNSRSLWCIILPASMLTIILGGCLSNQRSTTAAEFQENTKLGSTPAFVGLRWWREHQRNVGKSFEVATARRQLFKHTKAPLFDQVAFLSLDNILLKPRYDQEDQHLYIINALEKPVRARRVQGAKRPDGFTADTGFIISFEDGYYYRIFHNFFFPFQVKGIERIDPKARLGVWVPLGSGPQELLQDIVFVDLEDIPWESVDRENTAYWEGALARPMFRGPWQVFNSHGKVVALGSTSGDRFITFQNRNAWRYGQAVFISAQTMPASPEQVRQLQKDPYDFPSIGHSASTDLGGGFYGYNEGAATIYSLKHGDLKQNAEAWVLKAADYPPLDFLQPHFDTRGSSGETRDALVLPDGVNVAYVWRGRAIWPPTSLLETLEDRIMEPEQAVKLPNEIFDIVVLVLAARDGTKKILDFQMGYTRKLIKPHDPSARIMLDSADPKPNAGKAVKEDPKGKVEVVYRPQYLWTLDEEGVLQEQTIAATLNAEPGNNYWEQNSPFYAWRLMRLIPMNLSNNRYLTYFKGHELWMADLKAVPAD